MKEKLIRLDIGCGNAKKEGFIGVDFNPKADADMTWNLDGNLSVKDDSVSEIYTRMTLEHLTDVYGALREFHRVLIPNGTIEIIVPHFSHSNAYSNLEHKHFFTYYTFRSAEGLEYYTGCKFKVLKNRIKFIKIWRWIGLEWLFNKIPEIYTNIFPFIFVAGEIHVELQVVK